MDINFSAQDLEFRDEVRQFFANEYKPTQVSPEGVKPEDDYKDAMIRWQKKLYAKGWIAPGWPKEYGGTGWTVTQKFIYETERGAAGIPDVVPFGLKMVAPVIYTFGTEEQKAKFLPRILSSDDWWCQGYSEPGAGSDLAALQTRAVSDGDSYVVNGSKIWTSGADKADWIFCLVRTDPKASKHEGISFVLFPMDASGVTVKPIVLIAGTSPFCETFFDDVKVPKSERVGPENRGWAIAKRLLQHERFSIGGPSAPSKANKLSSIAKQYVGELGGKLADANLRDDILKNEMSARAFKLTTQRSAQENAKGESITFATSMFKYYSTELTCEEDELKLKAMGTQSLGWEGENFSRREIAITRSWLFDKALTIAGGSSEVQLNIIAKRVLALPD